MTSSYELLDHTADLGVRVFAGSLAELFKNAALALADLISGPVPLSGAKKTTLQVSGEDRVELLVNLLREQLYLFEGEKLLVADVMDVLLSDNGLGVSFLTKPYDPALHEIRHGIKAVTWHQAGVEERDGVWEARVIFDV